MRFSKDFISFLGFTSDDHLKQNRLNDNDCTYRFLYLHATQTVLGWAIYNI